MISRVFSFGCDTFILYLIVESEKLTVDDQGSDDDDISETDKDTLAGQMGRGCGGSLKKIRSKEESDHESSTDDDKASVNDNDGD